MAFQNEINADGIRAAFVDTYDAHSWPAVRADLPAALKATAVDIANRATAP